MGGGDFNRFRTSIRTSESEIATTPWKYTRNTNSCKNRSGNRQCCIRLAFKWDPVQWSVPEVFSVLFKFLHLDLHFSIKANLYYYVKVAVKFWKVEWIDSCQLWICKRSLRGISQIELIYELHRSRDIFILVNWC